MTTNITKYILLVCCWLPPCFAFTQAPNWSIEAGAYQYNMSVVAQVVLDGVSVNSGNNLVGAFVNNELRGVASPMNIGGEDFYFLTIFSNVTSGEAIDFLVWLENQNDTFLVAEQIPFIRSSSVGNYPNGFELNLSLLNDFGITIAPIPIDTTLMGIAFESILLTDYLISQDNDTVVWTVQNSQHLNGTTSNGTTLTVTPDDPTWVGTDSLLVIGTETGTPNSLADSQYVWYTVLADYLGPDFTYIPVQFSDATHAFPDDSIGKYLVFEGDSLTYSYQLEALTGSEVNPNWSPPGAGSSSMILTIQLYLGESQFDGLGELAGFVNGQLAGKIGATNVNGENYYFLTLANIASGTIDFKFYDSNRSYLYEVSTSISYTPGISQGSFASPEQVNLAPFTLNFDTAGNWTVNIIDATWTGEQTAKLFATDVEYPAKQDSIEVIFSKGMCAFSTIEICPSTDTCWIADGSLTDVVWFKDGLPVAESIEYAPASPGWYHYEGRDANDCLNTSCNIVVEEWIGCNGNFDPVTYPSITLNLPDVCDTLTYKSYTSKASCCYVGIHPKAFLQGPYDSGLDLMEDDLRQANYIPLTEPYTALSMFTHRGVGGREIVNSSVFQISDNNAIVDWVFLELRDKNDSLNVLSTQSALIQKDGDIVGLNGTSTIEFLYQCPDDYFLALRHRNHLGILTATALAMSETPIVIDFTDNATVVWGTNARKDFGNGKMGLWGGNAKSDDGVVRATPRILPPPSLASDISYILDVILVGYPNMTIPGYNTGDVNMDGKVRMTPVILPPPGIPSDASFILDKVLEGNPNATRTEQLGKN